jgi:hypothetical protein
MNVLELTLANEQKLLRVGLKPAAILHLFGLRISCARRVGGESNEVRARSGLEQWSEYKVHFSKWMSKIVPYFRIKYKKTSVLSDKDEFYLLMRAENHEGAVEDALEVLRSAVSALEDYQAKSAKHLKGETIV